jgi:hypothetical protein
MGLTMKYDEHGDSVAVLVRGEIGPGDTADVCQLDSDRIIRYDALGQVIEYRFLNARRLGVRLDDLPHRSELEPVFRAQGFPERDWSEPVQIMRVRRRRNVTAS